MNKEAAKRVSLRNERKKERRQKQTISLTIRRKSEGVRKCGTHSNNEKAKEEEGEKNTKRKKRRRRRRII